MLKVSHITLIAGVIMHINSSRPAMVQ